ncbi:TadE/TadG family type IV pilus assembly protein [Streptomyces sp. TRM 70351]|uniref:TadE/TadG family type IV pilus assembly protein n=1 Tax=Streptomyces sp. TRM 70351 TaxID=3116552 RepID=UPI002E7B96AB|nr:TadE/TadG family type IV pilus assembly protein [Streptomyces sp. TRM 70351]MEE1927808.1 TadE/TadG family type IV pilus assembly protein [Streptomyces sp. TRM 70351]
MHRPTPGRRDATGGGRRGDAGQVTVEFLGMVPLILLTLVLLWQFVLVGYTFTLAGNAADEAARAGAVGDDCAAAASADLPAAWRSGAAVGCGESGGLVTATVTLTVPVLFPGAVSFPFDVTGDAAAVSEEPPQ